MDKLDANTYMTHMEGKKFKVAHKSASKDKWNIKEKAQRNQRKKLISFLERVINNLKAAGQDMPVPYVVAEKERIYGLAHRNKKELYDRTAARNIQHRSKMSRGELLDAIQETLNSPEEPGEKKTVAQKLQGRSKEDLYRIADKKAIKGRPKMKKADLVKALKKKGTPQELAG